MKQRKRKCIDTNDDKKHSHSIKKANMSVHHAAAKEIFENEEIKRLREEIEQLKKVREPQNPLVKVNSTCLLIFLSTVTMYF